ncbi:probable protein phosphatase 2C 52 [Cimex lectularius]|uniref:protein-serine/threonine phosphatase n=1 Tax=Cimex lectularius TaxID=79782 RepID=A0A8I6RID2_CIMLE|nr:probable protein phosphatase 2C 52 [Cimex lectularius]
MEKDNDETNNDERSRPKTDQEQEKEKSRAEITDVCTPASSQIQAEKETGGRQGNVPKEKRKCCSHKLRKQDPSKAQMVVQPGATADQDRPNYPNEQYEIGPQPGTSQVLDKASYKIVQCSEEEKVPSTSEKMGHSLEGGATDMTVHRGVLQRPSDAESVEQWSSMAQEQSEIKLIEQRSSITQESSEIEFLVGQLSSLTQESSGTQLGEQRSSIPQRSDGTKSLEQERIDAVARQRSRSSLQLSEASSPDSKRSIQSETSLESSSTDTILNFPIDNADDYFISLKDDEQRSSSLERKRTRIDAMKIAEPLPSKKPRLEYENKDFDTSDDAEHNRPEDGILVEVSLKTNDVLEMPDGEAASPATTKPLTPKTKESVKVANPTTDRKMKKPKHPKRLPILLEAPVTEKYTVFMKNDRWKVVGGGMQGWRIRMEDAHVTLLETPLDPTVAFFGVFDGHGGNEVSNYVARHLYKFILQSDRFHLGEIDIAIKEGYMNIDNHMRENDIGKFRQGTTAITLMIKDQTVYCANVGDSRAIAVIDGEVVPLSEDQKPTLPEEAKRIGMAGLPILNNRVSGGLAMSRSLGDFRYKSFRHLSALQQPVIAQPEIVKKSLTDSWEFVVIACDGIWDVMSNDLVAAFVKDKIKNDINLSEICESLFMKCLAPSAFFPNKGCDNMTAIIILFSEELTKTTCLRSITDKEECKQKLSVNG